MSVLFLYSMSYNPFEVRIPTLLEAIFHPLIGGDSPFHKITNYLVEGFHSTITLFSRMITTLAELVPMATIFLYGRERRWHIS